LIPISSIKFNASANATTSAVCIVPASNFVYASAKVILSFTIKGIHPHDIATILDDDGVAIRAGHHCCQILHEKIGMSATARASIGIYNTKEDIDILINAIEKCKKVFKI